MAEEAARELARSCNWIRGAFEGKCPACGEWGYLDIASEACECVCGAHWPICGACKGARTLREVHACPSCGGTGLRKEPHGRA